MAGTTNRYRAACDMKRFRAVALYANMVHLGIIGKGNFRYRIGNADSFPQGDIVFHDRYYTTRLSNHQTAGMICGPGLRRDKQEVNRALDHGIPCCDNKRAIMEEGGIKRRKQVVAKFHVLPQMRLDSHALPGDGIGQISGRYTGIPYLRVPCRGRLEGQVRRKCAIYKNEPDGGFIQMEVSNLPGLER